MPIVYKCLHHNQAHGFQLTATFLSGDAGNIANAMMPVMMLMY